MKGQDVKEQFIELRAQGMSYNKISEKIDASVPTLMKWDKELNREIRELKFIRFEELKEKYLMNKQARLEGYGDALEKAKNELKARDFKDVSSDKLLSIIKDLEDRFKEEIGGISCHSEEIEAFGGMDTFSLSTPKYIWDLKD